MASFFWVRPLFGPIFGPPFWGKSRFCWFRGNESQGFWDLIFAKKRVPKSHITFLAKKRDFWRFHSTKIFANALFDLFFDRSFLWKAGKNRVVEWNRQNRDLPDFSDFREKWVNYIVIFNTLTVISCLFHVLSVFLYFSLALKTRKWAKNGSK